MRFELAMEMCYEIGAIALNMGKKDYYSKYLKINHIMEVIVRMMIIIESNRSKIADLFQNVLKNVCSEKCTHSRQASQKLSQSLKTKTFLFDIARYLYDVNTRLHGIYILNHKMYANMSSNETYILEQQLKAKQKNIHFPILPLQPDVTR
ncbi:hypothetical protein LAZ67_19001357 [Cordylochernes scorpioides]|uniref:Uncharacterized protein n=1 Tax=Cordylochernes scorpioides TaxID=51811 RepID=A0ABY6LHV7_9ARAC|nr:hypothetical protein LAZ67_19001357 [Cordylochernes scorpioides]